MKDDEKRGPVAKKKKKKLHHEGIKDYCAAINTSTTLMCLVVVRNHILDLRSRGYLQSAPTASTIDLKPSLSKHSANSAYERMENKERKNEIQYLEQQGPN